MSTVNRLQAALRLAEQLGYQVRHEWLGGTGGGACQLRGRKLLFVDLALGPEDQLEHVLAALHEDPQASRQQTETQLQQSEPQSMTSFRHEDHASTHEATRSRRIAG